MPALRRKSVPVWTVNSAIVILIAALWPISSAFDKYMDNYVLDVLIRMGFAIILAVSLNLINGITGQFSLGHAGFMAIGAYTGGVLLKHYRHDLAGRICRSDRAWRHHRGDGRAGGGDSNAAPAR